MAQTGKFIPGGKRGETASKMEPIRAPTADPAAGGTAAVGSKRLFAGASASKFVKPVEAKKRPGVTIISVLFCVLFISIGWYYLAVIPARHAAMLAQAELDKQRLEFETFKKKQEEERLAAEKRQAEARATLKVDSSPRGAVVTIAGQMQKTPAEFRDLVPGQAAVKVEFPGYRTVSKTVALEGEKTVNLGTLSLERKVGQIKITSNMPNAGYVLTGPDNFIRRGSLPLNIDTLPEGEYSLVATHKEWEQQPVSLSVKDGHEIARQINFTYSSLTLESVPSGATVKSGRQIIGQTPLVLNELRPSTRDYLLDLTGYRPAKIQVRIGDGVDEKKTVVLEKSNDLVTSFGMVMAWLPAGYWAGKYEVTQKEYQKVMGGNPSYFRGQNKPVDSVTWTQAMDFCARATELEKASGKLPEGHRFTLPTEGQWEYLVADSDPRNSVLSWEKQLQSSSEVGTGEPNQLGLYDVVGNVWEWCSNAFDANGKARALRGGSWLSSKDNFPSAGTRNGAGEHYRDRFTGFRCVLVKEAP